MILELPKVSAEVELRIVVYCPHCEAMQYKTTELKTFTELAQEEEDHEVRCECEECGKQFVVNEVI